MPRGYYKEPDVKYGRPKVQIVSSPPGFEIYDTSNWNARRFLRELVKRQINHDWKKQRPEWRQWNIRGNPLADLDEINAFLCRPPPVSQIDSAEKADHALRLGMILIAVDPNTPDLTKRLGTEAEKIRQTHPLLIKKSRGRPSKSGNIGIINPAILNAWRVHRIVELHELRLKGYDPRKERKQMAAWLYPDQKNQRKRGEMLDRGVELLDEALAAARVIDAQTR
jgi:hypothetical protein